MRRSARRAPRGRRGTTLADVMAATAVVGVCLLALLSSFGSVARLTQSARDSTLAAALCQERMEELKSTAYGLLRPTPQADINALGHDATFYPPERLSPAGAVFTRYVLVTRVNAGSGGELHDLPPEAPDAGAKKIHVWTVWSERGAPHRSDVVSLLGDPAFAALPGSVAGVVYAAPGGAGRELPGVSVSVLDNPGWTDLSSAAGAYSIATAAGALTLRAAKAGYYPATAAAVASPRAAGVDFTLFPRGTGTVSGRAYVRQHLVISQVVSDTDTSHAEYVELYNPTTWTWRVDGSSIRLLYVDAAGDPVDLTPSIAFGAAAVAADGGFYLIANTATVRAGGLAVPADAVYSAALPGESVIRRRQAGGIILEDGAGNVLDRVGWSCGDCGQAAPAAAVAGYALPLADGLDAGEQIVRWDFPDASAMSAADGRSWTSGDDAADFNNQEAGPAKDMPLLYPPRDSASVAAPRTGAPAVGAVVSASDDLSAPAAVVSSTGYFLLAGVATGAVSGAAATWTVTVSSRELFGTVAGVAVPAGGLVDLGVVALSSAGDRGTIAGTVLDCNGAPLSGVIVVCSGVWATTTPGGAWEVAVTAGDGLTCVANPSSPAGAQTPRYDSSSSGALAVLAGQSVTGVDFTLDPAGSAAGWVTGDGASGLAGVTVQAAAPPGVARGTAITDASGRFTIAGLPASALPGVGPYTVGPVIDPSETAAPATADVTVAQDGTVDVGTFTVAGAMGVISGTVRSGGAPIRTGVLLVASLAAPGSAPPVFDEALRGGATAYYSAHSEADGSYHLSVKASSSPYHVAAWYASESGGSAATVLKTATVAVSSPAAAYAVDFSWP